VSDERSYDFEIVCPNGSILKGAFCEAQMVGLYNEHDELVFVGPTDLDWLRGFGTVNAGMLVRARLELDAGLSV
jgi:hypothetical protein